MNTKNAKITIVDEINLHVGGLDATTTKCFVEKFRIHPKNYRFVPSFIYDEWDGYINFFGNDCCSYTSLLPRIVEELKRHGYKITIDDERPNIMVIPPVKDTILKDIGCCDIVMRDYQLDAVNAALGVSIGIINAATAAGKTIINGAIVHAYNLRSMTIVPSTNLVTQTYNSFVDWGLDAGMYYSEVKNTSSQHLITTWQSLQNNPSLMATVDLVVVDECHGCTAKVLADLLNNHGRHIKYRYGLTATLPDNACDEMTVRTALHDTVYTISAKTLMDRGFLATLHINILQLVEDFRPEYDEYVASNPVKPMTYLGFVNGYFPDFASEKKYLQKNQSRLEFIADYMELKRESGNVLCLVNGVQMGKDICGRIDGAVFLSGSNKKKVREEAFELFDKHDNIVVILTFQIGGVGLSIDRVYNLITIDGGASFIKTMQGVGRGLRVTSDKSHLCMTDFTSNLKYSKKHTNQRRKFYRDAFYPHTTKKIVYC